MIFKRIYFNNSLAKIFLLMILLLALFIRLKSFSGYDMLADEAHYMWHAGEIHKNFLHVGSHAILKYHSPLFPFLLSLSYFFQEPEFISRVFLMVFNLLGIVGIYIVGLQVGSVFIALFSALALALSPVYECYADRIMADSSLLVFFIFFTSMMLKIDGKTPLRGHVYLGIAGSVILLLKWTGILLFPFCFISYCIIFRHQSFQEKFLRIIVLFVPMILATGFLLLSNFLSTGSMLPSLLVFGGVNNPGSFGYYLFHFYNIFFLCGLIPFFVYGLFLSFSRKMEKARILGVWFVVFFVGVSLAREKDIRYVMVVLPPALLLTSLGIKFFLENSLKGRAIFFAKGFFLAFLLSFFPISSLESMKAMNRFSGNRSSFQEAATWLNAQPSQEAIIVASSVRLLRYYSRIGYQSDGGRIVFLPQKIDDFKALVGEAKIPVFLFVDWWKTSQPAWVYPVSEETIKKLKELNFFLAKTIKGCVFEKGRKIENVPVVWIFEYRPQQP